MGIFDKLVGGREGTKHTLNRQESVAAILLAISNADGEMAPEERDRFISTLLGANVFASMNRPSRDNLFEKLFGLMDKEGAAGLMALGVKYLPTDLRDTVFVYAVDLVLADGVVEQAEREFLTNLKKALQIPDDLAHRVIEVVKIKNKA